MAQIKKFRDIPDGEKSRMTLLVHGMEDRTTTKNKNYASVQLFDGDVDKRVSFFDTTVAELREKGMDKGVVIKVMLKHNGTYYNYNKEGWGPNKDPEITPADFKHAAPIDPEAVFDWLLMQVKSVDSNPDCAGPYRSLSYLTARLLNENAEAFKRSSAAVAMHHNYLSGLLHHTQRMVGVAMKLCDVYTELDRELLVCGTALHDIGKISSYVTTDIGDAEVSVPGRLLGHALEGILMIQKEAEQTLYNPEQIEMLEHMIASHHGQREWGACTIPAFPEAQALHLIDMIDSRMNMFEIAYKDQEAGTLSEKKVFGLDDYIYKPLYPEA